MLEGILGLDRLHPGREDYARDRTIDETATEHIIGSFGHAWDLPTGAQLLLNIGWDAHREELFEYSRCLETTRLMKGIRLGIACAQVDEMGRALPTGVQALIFQYGRPQ